MPMQLSCYKQKLFEHFLEMAPNISDIEQKIRTMSEKIHRTVVGLPQLGTRYLYSPIIKTSHLVTFSYQTSRT